MGLAHGWYPPKSNLGLKRIFSFTLLVVIKTNIHIPCSEVLSRNLELEEAKKKERTQARVWGLRVKMGVTKEKVESTLTSKLNPSHLVSSSFTIFVLLFELCIFYFYASSHSHHPHIGLLICQFRVGK